MRYCMSGVPWGSGRKCCRQWYGFTGETVMSPRNSCSQNLYLNKSIIITSNDVTEKYHLHFIIFAPSN